MSKMSKGGQWVLGCLLMIGLSSNVQAGSIDMPTVYDTWLGWNNALRADMKLPLYTLDSNLQATSLERSTTAATRGEITHKRDPKKDAYYDYAKIQRRFGDRGVTFKNINRSTFSESIGWGVYSCKQEDCTQSLIAAVKSTWNFFYSEKNKKSQPHYAALVHKNFAVMGIGIAVDEKKKRYYLTVHYATQVVKK